MAHATPAETSSFLTSLFLRLPWFPTFLVYTCCSGGRQLGPPDSSRRLGQVRPEPRRPCWDQTRVKRFLLPPPPVGGTWTPPFTHLKRQKVRVQPGPPATLFLADVQLVESGGTALKPGIKVEARFSQGLVSQSGTWLRSQRDSPSVCARAGETGARVGAQVSADLEIMFHAAVSVCNYGPNHFSTNKEAHTFRASGLLPGPAAPVPPEHHHLVIQHVA